MDYFDLYDIFVQVFYVVSLLSFTIYLSLCFCSGDIYCGLKSRRKPVIISKEDSYKIREVFHKRKEKLLELVIDVEVARLENGSFKYSTTTLDAEQKLFLELKSARNELSSEQSKSDEVKKVLKCLLMRNPYDLRGARRLSSIVEQYKNCQENKDYNITALNNTKRKMSRFSLSCKGCHCSTTYEGCAFTSSYDGLSCLRGSAKSSSISFCCADGTNSSRTYSASVQPKEGPSELSMKLITGTDCIILPCVLIAMDMFYSDTMVLYRLINYLLALSNQNENSSSTNLTVISTSAYSQYSGFTMVSFAAMVGLLLYVYLLSLYGIMSSHSVSSLKTSYDTGIHMADAVYEKQSTPIPIESVTRYDLSINESSIESAWQSCLQWSAYLMLQLHVRTEEVGEELDLTFHSLYISALLSTFSLTMAQMKANQLLTEYQTTVTQQGVYFCACLASTVSSQLLTTICIVTVTDLGMTIMMAAEEIFGTDSGLVAPVGITLDLFGFFALLAIITLLTLNRLSVITKLFNGTSVLTITSEVESWLTKIGHIGMSYLTIQPLHLQTSKTRVLTKKAIFYPGEDSEEYFFKENLVLLLLMIPACVLLFIFNNVIIYLHVSSPQDLPYSWHLSPARSNFLLICSILIPGGWVFGQIFIKLFYHLDNGPLTCGARFKFDDTEGKTGIAEDGLTKQSEMKNTSENTHDDIPGSDDSLVDIKVEATGDKQCDSDVCEDNKNSDTHSGLSEKLGNFCRVDKVNFLSKTGRWVEDDEWCQGDEEEEK